MVRIMCLIYSPVLLFILLFRVKHISEVFENVVLVLIILEVSEIVEMSYL